VRFSCRFNGLKVGNTVAGGKEYSDSDGNELGGTQITKTATINSYNNEKVISINKDGVFEYGFIQTQDFRVLLKT
jgi:hypothetical protein